MLQLPQVSQLVSQREKDERLHWTLPGQAADKSPGHGLDGQHDAWSGGGDGGSSRGRGMTKLVDTFFLYKIIVAKYCTKKTACLESVITRAGHWRLF